MDFAKIGYGRTTNKVIAIALAATSLIPAISHAATDQPRVVSYGNPIGTYSVTCDGTICEVILDHLSGPDLWNPNPTVKFPTGNKVDQEQFCRNMEMAKPANCDANNPPSSPGIDPNWIGNGCGDGSFKVAILEKVLELGMANYSGSLDNPLPSISFFGACQSHDQCYGMAPSKAWCDNAFGESLYSACSLGTSTYHSQCQALADAYVSAVEVGGMDAHNQAQDDRACAAWAKDMEQNGCNE